MKKWQLSSQQIMFDRLLYIDGHFATPQDRLRRKLIKGATKNVLRGGTRKRGSKIKEGSKIKGNLSELC